MYSLPYLSHHFPLFLVHFLLTSSLSSPSLPGLATYAFRRRDKLSFSHWLLFRLEIYDAEVSGGVRPELNRENGGKGIFASRPLTRHPHSPKRGVILCHKSLGSLNHTQDTLLPFLITAVSLHLYSIREINGPEYSAQVDILLWGT